MKQNVAMLIAILALSAWGVAAEEMEAGAPPGRAWRVSDWNTSARIDYQVMAMRMSGADPMTESGGTLMAAELETTATLNNGERDLVNIAIQWPYLTEMRGIEGRGKEMHFGNAYLVYKTGLGKPDIRAGQFVVPFGNLTSYETHTRPLQSLYPQSLGVRIDRGVSIEGLAGEYDYWVAAMGGNGARRDNNDSPILVGRVARRFDLENGGTLTAGVSGLHGTAMPRFSTLVDPVMEEAMMGMPLDHSLSFTEKTRVALDAEYLLGADIWRVEIVGGRDADGGVNGQFVQWNRALGDKAEMTAQAARWEEPTGSQLRLGTAYGYQLNASTVIRAAVERHQGRAHGEERNGTTWTLQLARDFPGIFTR